MFDRPDTHSVPFQRVGSARAVLSCCCMTIPASSLSPAAQRWLRENTVPGGDGRLADLAKAQRELEENWNLTPLDRLELVATRPAEERRALLEALPGWQRKQALGDSAVSLDTLRSHQTGPVYAVDFDVLGPGHSGAKAHAMAVLAKRAYESLGLEGAPPVAFTELRAQGWTVTALGAPSVDGCDPATSTQAFVAIKGDRAIFCARGTEPDRMQDLLVDAKLCRVPTPHGHSHEGFVLATDQVWGALKEQLAAAAAALGRPLQLHLTGHSLGAAIATETAMRVHDELAGKVSVDGVYTFGSPRVYDREAAAEYHRALGDRTHRYCNHRDVVTIIPPADFGFEHVGRRYYFDGDGALRPELGARGIARDKLRPIEVMTTALANLEPTEVWDHGGYVKQTFLAKDDPIDRPKTNLAQLEESLKPRLFLEDRVSPHAVLCCLPPAERSRLLFDLTPKLARGLVEQLGATHATDLTAWLLAAPAAIAKHATLRTWLRDHGA
ncbi:lipase family protein [Myxococcota bacterium]|nr:lipase family protein [Myxococcota bacterium]